MSDTIFLVVEIVSVGFATLSTMWVTHYRGLRCGSVIAVMFAILMPYLTSMLETHEQKRQRDSLSVKAMTQEEFDALEEPDDRTLRVIVPKKPEP